MAIFAVVGVVAVLAYLYGQKRAASRRLREAVARTLAECESNAGLAADGVPIGASGSMPPAAAAPSTPRPSTWW